MGDAHAAKNTSLKVTGASVPFNDEPLTLVAGSGGKVWQISSLAKDVWDPTTTFTVAEDVDSDGIIDAGEEIASSSYEIDYLFGVVRFDTDRTGQTILASGAYHPHYFVPMGRAVSWNSSYNTLDASVFFDTGPRMKLGQRSLDATVEHIDTEALPLDGQAGTEDTLGDILGNGRRLVLEYGPQGTADGTPTGARQGKVRRAWARLTNDSKSLSLGELVGSELSFQLASVNAAQAGQSASSIDVFNYS